MHYNSIFQQLFNFIPRHRFEKSVKKLSGDRYCKCFTAWKQFLTLLYAQISGKDSLREIENGLLANHKRLFLHGFKLSLTEITNRIRDTLMQNLSLLKILCLDKKTIQKPPDWNLPEQPDLFTPFLC